MAGVLLVQVARLHLEVEGAFAAAGLDAGHALHLGGRFEILEVMRLVDEQLIDAELVEDQAVVGRRQPIVLMVTLTMSTIMVRTGPW